MALAGATAGLSSASFGSHAANMRNENEQLQLSCSRVCLDHLNGRCEGRRTQCRYLHPDVTQLRQLSAALPQGRKLCKVFMLTRNCKFGDECADIHPTLKVIPLLVAAVPLNKDQQLILIPATAQNPTSSSVHDQNTLPVPHSAAFPPKQSFAKAIADLPPSSTAGTFVSRLKPVSTQGDYACPTSGRPVTHVLRRRTSVENDAKCKPPACTPEQVPTPPSLAASVPELLKGISFEELCRDLRLDLPPLSY